MSRSHFFDFPRATSQWPQCSKCLTSLNVTAKGAVPHLNQKNLLLSYITSSFSEIVLHFIQREKRYLLSSFKNGWLIFKTLFTFNDCHKGSKSPKYRFRSRGANPPWKFGRLDADRLQTVIDTTKKEKEQQNNVRRQSWVTTPFVKVHGQLNIIVSFAGNFCLGQTKKGNVPWKGRKFFLKRKHLKRLSILGLSWWEPFPWFS